ncbi:4-hydroxythreonine-4-phosphate dehydrogenase PdxA [bacterium]|nr:4-hydroxythreonine-4-phosphate dehydrogenase PdxA [bacterium]
MAFSLGDPAGIGPEVVLGAVRDRRLSGLSCIIVGDEALVREATKRLGLERSERARVVSPDSVRCEKGVLFSGKATEAGGRAAAAAVREAVSLIERGEADALVTAPLNKEALGLAGEPFPGHTELLSSLLRVSRTRMMLAGGPLRVVLATTHLALRDVAGAITREGVRDTILVAREALVQDFGIEEPRIGVCALNPHASDGGRFGDEEERIVSPAIEDARRAGASVTGPHPADTFFAKAARKRSGIDAVVALYHDQGLIPLKVVSFGVAVNVTLGLPIVRTSPDHGTAYDIAGKGVAEVESLVNAALVAREIVLARRQARGPIGR